ncbi:MAG: peptide-methionine (S)-S-oxide reductase MsrA [Nitrosomonas sp.]|nr:peptide-methionine (S)-S-oxide reductase MsrA [Nitrosomonas sp.]
MTNEKIIFGAGCFWGVEAAFRRLEGIVDTACGYTGGQTEEPTYETVCSGMTGHIEVVKVVFDPLEITLETLLDHFWHCHDPTSKDKQGGDIGSQYRSVIFYFSPNQAVVAKLSLQALQQSNQLQATVVTEVLPATRFYLAEEYHQRYFEKHGLGSH